MFDEPNESPAERRPDPAARASEKSDEFRMHAELCAVFEGPRKFAARLLTDLSADLARDVQQRMARLEKARLSESALLPDPSAPDAAALLNLHQAAALSTNDYHIHRRPGEVMLVRWLEGAEVDTFYQRLQAHFDAALNGYREEERQSQGWKQDAETLAYLAALDAVDVKMANRYLRDAIRTHTLSVLSTQSADELDILFLCDYVMGVDPADLVGAPSAPPDQPTERDRAWFFKLFSLRSIDQGVEKMCFFTFLQKSDDSGW